MINVVIVPICLRAGKGANNQKTRIDRVDERKKVRESSKPNWEERKIMGRV